MKLSSLKNDCSLFSRLYVACQVRDGNLDDFFAHENHAFPPSLSHAGNLRIGNKSQLAECLTEVAGPKAEMPEVDAIMIDGAAIINMLSPRQAQTFLEYASTIFKPFIMRQLQTARRVDIIWDQYLPNSLKSSTREKRGKGIRRRVTPEGLVPTNWPGFLRVDENKAELFHFIAKYIEDLQDPLLEGKEIRITHGPDVLSNPQQDEVSRLAPCSQEEADTRWLLHAADAGRSDHQGILLRIVDTDVLVLASFLWEAINN